MPCIALEINRKCLVFEKLFRVNKLDSQVCSKRCNNIALKRRRDAEAKEVRLDKMAIKIPYIREHLSVKEAVAMFNIERGHCTVLLGWTYLSHQYGKTSHSH